ncbi:hypothetical protein V502_00539, partial [Pseudogymnoascus sp. VKM F-4520 (FW-2644)]
LREAEATRIQELEKAREVLLITSRILQERAVKASEDSQRITHAATSLKLGSNSLPPAPDGPNHPSPHAIDDLSPPDGLDDEDVGDDGGDIAAVRQVGYKTIVVVVAELSLISLIDCTDGVLHSNM